MKRNSKEKTKNFKDQMNYNPFLNQSTYSFGSNNQNSYYHKDDDDQDNTSFQYSILSNPINKNEFTKINNTKTNIIKYNFHSNSNSNSNIANSQNQQLQHELESKGSTCQFGTKNKIQLCCRTVFTQNQIIQSPQSDIYQFKSYSFPFIKQRLITLQKTMCGFLNSEGGFIFIGIQQNVLTKQHRVVGGKYNETEKQQIHKMMRRIAQSIQPDIVINTKFKTSFVPVKSSLFPYSYIEGRYVIKLKILPGVRDQVYTVRADDGIIYMCMRTENQVLTYQPKRQIRKILAVQKQRALSPLGKPRKIHKHQCKKPQQGLRLFSQENRMLAKFQTKKNVNEQSLLSRESLILVNRRRKSKSPSHSPQKDRKSSQTQCYKSSKSPNKLDKSKSSQKIKNSLQPSQPSKSRKRRQKRKKKQKQMINSIMLANKNQSTKKSSIQLKLQKIDKQLQISKRNSKELANIDKSKNNINQKIDYPSEIINNNYSKIVKTVQKSTQKYYYNNEHKSYNKNSNIILNRTNISQVQKSNEKQKKLNGSNNFKYIAQFMVKQSPRSVQQKRKFIDELKVIDQRCYHRIFGFAGFSKSRIEYILFEFANIGQYEYYQFNNLLIYKFSKQTNENNLKIALTKAVQHVNDNRQLNSNLNSSKASSSGSSNGRNYKQFQFKVKKQQKSFNNQLHQQSQSQTQQNNKKKSKRIIFKLTNRIKILNYSKMANQVRQKIKEKIQFIQLILGKKKAIFNEFAQESSGKVPKTKQLVFRNLYLSLLAFLQLRQYNYDLVFY